MANETTPQRSGTQSASSFWIVAAFWALLLPLYVIWVRRDQGVAPWDMSIHARCAWNAWDALRHGRFLRIYELSDYYPPLFHLLAAPFSLFSTHPDAYCPANWGVLLLVMGAAWRLGRTLAGSAAGVAAGCLVPAYLYVSWICCQSMSDLTLTATVTVALALLADGGRLDEPGPAHALGVTIALGLLAKWPFVFFTGLPLAWVAGREGARGWRAGRMREFLQGLGWVCFWPLLLAGPWYLQALPNLCRQVGHQLVDVPARVGLPPVWSLASLSFYARALERDYLRLPLTVLLAVGAASLLIEIGRQRGSTDKKLSPLSPFRPLGLFSCPRQGWVILALALVSGYGIMSMLGNKDPRYVMPLVPLLAVISTCWVARLEAKRLRATAVAAVMLFALAMAGWALFGIRPPDRREMGVESLAERLVRRAGREKQLTVLVIPNEWTINAASLDYALYRRNRRFGAKNAPEVLTEQIMRQYRYVVLTQPAGENAKPAPRQKENTRLAETAPGWDVCETVQRGDGRKIVVLKRRE